METINILMVEDDSVQQQLYSDAVEDYCQDLDGIEMNLIFSTNATDAMSKLDSISFDVVFLDLLLDGDTSSEGIASGNQVLTHILDTDTIRPVVYIVSGTLHSLESRFNDVFENPLMRKFSRDEDTNIVLSDLIKVWKTGVTKILGRSGKLNKLINEIYFKHLAKGFSFWQDKGIDMESALLRYTALHLTEYLDLPEKDSEQERESSYFEPEFYIYPPIKNSISTGDIIDFDSKKYVLLTPACDISPRQAPGKIEYNVDTVILAELVKLDKNVFDVLGIKYHLTETTPKRWDAFERDQRTKQQKQRFHYIPKYLDICESVIDFKRLRNIPIQDYLDNGKTKRIATISTPFLRDIQSRFSSYYGRQGQPNGSWAQ
jgi:CheY-like chemotaxis protein